MASDQPESITHAIVEDLAAGADDPGERICVLDDDTTSVDEFARHVRVSLMSHQLVFHTYSGSSPLQQNLLAADADTLRILSPGFQKLVVLNVAEGLNEAEEFDLPKFYRYAFVQLAGDIDEESQLEGYHEEDMVQMLKDEPDILLCILNAHLAPSLERKRLRCLTQEGRSALIVYENGGVRAETPPQLQAINGPIAGHTCKIERDQVSIGRNPDCEIVVEVGAVSRRHAKIERRPDGYYLSDLKSRNGTWLNGQRVDSATSLRNGDRIRICDIDFIFNDAADSRGQTQHDSSPDVEVANDFDDDGTVREFPAALITTEVESRANELIEDHCGACKTENELWERFIDAFFEALPQVDRAGVLARNDQEEFSPVVLRTRKPDDNIRFSRAALRRVVDEREAALIADAIEEDRFQASMNIADLKIRSIMCAPLIDAESDVVGVFHAETSDLRRRFDETNLSFLVAMTNAVMTHYARIQNESA